MTKTLHLSKDERKENDKLRDEYFKRLDPDYRKQIPTGNYHIRDRDRAAGAPGRQ